MATPQRVRIGADSFYMAKLLTDPVGGPATWDTPFRVPNGISFEFDPSSSVSRLYADNGVAFAAETVGDMSLKFSTANLTPELLSLILGHTRTNGVIDYSVVDQSPAFAIGARIMFDSGVYGYTWFYNVKFTKPSSMDKTKEASVEFKIDEMEGAPIKIQSGLYKVTTRSDDPDVLAATLTNWFNQPFLSTMDATALTATIAEGTAGNAGKIEATFAKGSGASFGISVASVTADNFIVTTATGGKRAGSYTVAANGTTVKCTFTPSVAFSGADIVGVAITSGVKDAYGVSATPTGDVITIA